MDRTTKLLLAAIAIGLFANSLKPAGAVYGLGTCNMFSREPICEVATLLNEIKEQMERLSRGTCNNRKLC